MQKDEWLKKLVALLRPPEALFLDKKRARQAAQAIRSTFGPKHQKAASTCIDVLLLLIGKAKRYRIEGQTQKDLAYRFKWSHGTVGRYTRVLEDMGLIEIDRGRLKNGRVRPNSYILTFLMETVKCFKTGGEYIQHPVFTSIYLEGVGVGRLARAPT